MEHIELNSGSNLVEWASNNIDGFEVGELSDGYHTFNELYEFRKLYNATLFNEWAKICDDTYMDQGDHLEHPFPKYDIHKSLLWQPCVGDEYIGDEGWFIVMAELPTGQISNHYKIEDWDLFNIPEKSRCNKYDGHTSKDVSNRLCKLLTGF